MRILLPQCVCLHTTRKNLLYNTSKFHDKTFLLDKTIVHFPIKILNYFIKSKENKGNLILFSSLGLGHRTLCFRKVWLRTWSWSPANATNSLYATRNLLAQWIWSRLGSWHYLPEASKNIDKPGWNDLEEGGLSPEKLGLSGLQTPRSKHCLHSYLEFKQQHNWSSY